MKLVHWSAWKILMLQVKRNGGSIKKSNSKQCFKIFPKVSFFFQSWSLGYNSEQKRRVKKSQVLCSLLVIANKCFTWSNRAKPLFVVIYNNEQRLDPFWPCLLCSQLLQNPGKKTLKFLFTVSINNEQRTWLFLPTFYVPC